MITAPDKAIDVHHITPGIGGGNRAENMAAAELLRKKAAEHTAGAPQLNVLPPKTIISPLVSLAEWEHARISADAAAAIKYSANPRSGPAAEVLSAHLGAEAERLVQTTAENSQMVLLSPQNMTIEGWAARKPKHNIALALFLICPDVFGKFDAGKSAINNEIVHLFWNLEAYETAGTSLPQKNVKLIIPIDPLEAFPKKPERPLAKDGQHLIKLSGTGGHADTINALATQLTKLGLAPTVVCEMASKLDPYSKKKVDTESDAGWYYHSLGEANPQQPPRLICHPSEQVKHLIVLQKKGIFVPTIFLYPKGLHEVKNLAWAIKQGLSRVICVPKSLPNLKDPRAEVAKQLAAQGVNAGLYRFVDPGEITAADFEKPTKVWEQPPNALSLFDAIRSSLAGTAVTVNG